ncbi:hypothetical protein BKP37_07010 [Anaerobacillus alkalilacustris]|uniref:Uncharacterized protein n=1 Tax=Anaerobacillus alkalilacustris TaxID=393763 RepID=A0A1S2LRU1_9BACI|nr:hypothetical protein BKP37_07010 [Anaerobacillus alkalilacustris]
MFLTQKEVLKTLNITRPTLLRWEEKGLISPIFLDSGHRRYRKEDIDRLTGSVMLSEAGSSSKKKCVIYSRVSTKKQQETGNLKRQTERLIEYANANNYHVLEVFEEVASGINENRRALQRLMKKVSKEDIEVVLAEYKDRIARFGYEYIERYCKSHKTNIECIEEQDEKDLNQEMVEDMISVITSFSARLYGQRGARKVKNQLNRLEKEETI